MKNSKRAHRILAWLLTMTLIFTMSFSSVAYAADTDTTGEGEVNTTEATSEETTNDTDGDTTKASQEAEQEETQNPEALGEGATPAAEAVAKIGDNEYATFAEAVEAVQDGDTILLLDDIDITKIGVVDVNNCTIDLNNHKISADNFTAIFQGKNLTFKNGKFDSKGGSYALFIGDEGETDNVLVENCTFTGGINVHNASNIVLRNVNVTGTKYYAVWLDEGAKATIESGSYKSNGNKVLGLAEGDVGTTLAIKGGSFTYEENKLLWDNGVDGAKPVVTGGTFSTNPSEFVAAGYEAKKTGDSWTVAETHKVAEVNGTHKYETLAAAVASAKEGATITLLDNIDIDSQITISKSVTIDLNGHNIAATDARALHIAGGEVDIIGKGTISANKVGDFDSEYSVIRVGDDKGDARKAELTVGKKVTVSSNHCYGITVFGSNTKETVVVNGKVNVTGREAAISGNGSTGYGNTSITVNGEVYAKNDNAIYHPQTGKLIVNGTVTGTGGIEAKAGNTEIRAGSEAVITAMAGKTSHKRNDNGCSTSGYAIAAVQNAAYAGNAAITIEGGTINGPVDIVNDNEAEKHASIVIKGGTFSVEPKADFISKGYEAKKTGDSWTVDTIKVAKSGENEYASLKDAVKDVKDGGEITLLQDVSEKLIIDNSKTFTIDLNGKAYTGGYIYLHSGFVTVKNGTLNVTSWVFASDQDKQYNSLTVEEDVVIDGPDYGIISYQKAVGEDNYGSTINFHGTMKNVQNGIWVLGNIHTDLKKANNPIVINVDGTINAVSEGNAAVALNGSAIMKIEEGASIEGATAVEVRAGNLTVNDGALTGTAVPTNVTSNGNGTATLGAGLAVAQHATALPIDVTVNGGTIEGYTGLLVTNPENRGNADKVKVTVEGGSFKAIKDGTNSIAKEDNAAGMTLLVKGGYFSDSSADNYLAAGKVLLPSDEDGYKYKVGVKKSEIVVSTPAEGENKITGIDDGAAKDTIKNIDVDLDAAARIKVSEEDVSIDKAKQALTSAGVTVPEDAEVVVQVETFLKIEVEQYPSDTGSKYVLDIKPMYQLVAKTEVKGEEKTAVIGEAAPLEISNEIEVAIPIPDGFLIGNPDTITIKHTKDDGKVYYYSAKVVTKDGKTFAIFTNPNGFSKFQLMQQSDNVNIDTVELSYTEGSEIKRIGTTIEAGRFEYTAKFDAVKNAPEKVMADVTSTGTDKNARVKVLVDGREVKDKKVSIGLGTRTFNVLVLAEDSTAVLYTFNAVRCERVEDVTLNKDTFTYNGKAQAPAVTVKTAAGITLKNGDAYTVSYKGNKTSVGTHTVTVRCKDKYEGEISKNYTINPAKPAIKKIKSSKRKMTVYMTTKPGSKGAKYYRIYYKQKGSSTWKSTTTTSSSKTIKGLKKGKRYYVKAYAYTGSYKSAYSSTKLSKKIR